MRVCANYNHSRSDVLSSYKTEYSAVHGSVTHRNQSVQMLYAVSRSSRISLIDAAQRMVTLFSDVTYTLSHLLTYLLKNHPPPQLVPRCPIWSDWLCAAVVKLVTRTVLEMK